MVLVVWGKLEDDRVGDYWGAGEGVAGVVGVECAGAAVVQSALGTDIGVVFVYWRGVYIFEWDIC